LPRLLAIRERDHLVLEVSWSGLQLKHESGEPFLIRTQGGDGFLILIFAPQNLAEKAYYQIFQSKEEDKQFNTEWEEGDSESTKVIPVELDGDEFPESPPIDALLSDDSRLVFRVPKGTTIPLTVKDILDWAGRLEMSVPANALPREHRLTRLFVPAGHLLAEKVAIRGNQSMVERLMTSGRMREKVRGANTMVAEAADGLTGVIESHLLVTPESRAGTAISGVNVTDARTSVKDVIAALRRKRPKPALPAVTETAIESPYRLLISPSSAGGWAHSTEVVERNGRAELWHSRLGVSIRDEDTVEVDERSAFQRAVRAVWARGIDNLEDNANPPPAEDPVHPHPFRMSLEDRDRHNLVHLSSNFAISESGRFYSPEPVVVNRLMLTSLGSWMDFEGRWNPWPEGVSIEEWIHRATLGRDHYVRVVYQGFLADPGNKSTLVKITERMFASDVPEKNWGQSDNPAYLTQRMFIVVKEAEKTFDDTTATFHGSSRFANANPLKSIRILDRQTPDLDPPTDRTKFIPHVGGVPFEFTIVTTDVEGNEATTTRPLLFVDKTVDEKKELLQPALGLYNNNLDVRRVALSGQRVAYAPAKGLDDTTFETNHITFAATIPDGAYAAQGPHFRPRVEKAEVIVPAVRQLAGTADALEVEYQDDYLEHGFEPTTNKGEVLFRLPNQKSLDLSKDADKTGGLASPSINISGISRLLGPVGGNLDTIKSAAFTPSDFFSGISAMLFGVIPLSAVIEEVASFPDDLPKVPRFIGKTMDQVEAFLDDLARIEALVEEKPALLTLVKGAIGDVLTAVQKKLAGGAADLPTALGALDDALEDLENALPGGLPIGALNDVKAVVTRTSDALGDVAAFAELVETLVQGIELPRSVNARFEWRPGIKPWPNETNPLFLPQSDSLVLAAEARGSVNSGDFVVSATLEDFKLNLIGEETKFIVLDFEKIQLLVQAGKKPEVDVVLRDVVFTGVLEFVETLKDLIPLDAFSDPPAVTVDTDGIRADLSVGLPNVSVGVFSLENLALGGGFVVPFVGDPLSVYFRFCERENPALVSVSMFAGGFFFGITLDPGGVRILEAAIEFGANVSMDFGVASGGVSAMAGIYFKLELDDATLTGYFRVRGHVRALGIVTVSIELYLEMSYEFPTKKCVGRAQLSISIELFLFETTITISCEKKFAGSGDDPTFAQAMAPYQLDPSDPSSLIDPWEEYCVAFA